MIMEMVVVVVVATT
ncbi:unnamed protein product, partial [Allacma fusca]